MAIVDLDFKAWVESMRVEFPQAFHDATSPRQSEFRMFIAQRAFEAGKKAGRRPTPEPQADSYLSEARRRLHRAVREQEGSMVSITKADACAIGIALADHLPESSSKPLQLPERVSDPYELAQAGEGDTNA